MIFIPTHVFLIVCHRASIQTTRIPHHTNTLPCPRCANIVLFRYRQFSHPLLVLTMIPVPLGVIGANFCAIRLLLCGMGGTGWPRQRSPGSWSKLARLVLNTRALPSQCQWILPFFLFLLPPFRCAPSPDLLTSLMGAHAGWWCGWWT